MVIRINAKQSDIIKRMARKRCCNCVDSNCLLLDDGEEHKCVQLISCTGIYCNYFLEAVLPNDKPLVVTVEKQNKVRLCRLCGKPFKTKDKNRLYCKECTKRRKAQKTVKPKKGSDKREVYDGIRYNNFRKIQSQRD